MNGKYLWVSFIIFNDERQSQIMQREFQFWDVKCPFDELPVFVHVPESKNSNDDDVLDTASGA